MATEDTKAIINSPEGTYSVDLPKYAMESTLAKMLSEIEKLTNNSKATNNALKDIAENTADADKSLEDVADGITSLNKETAKDKKAGKSSGTGKEQQGPGLFSKALKLSTVALTSFTSAVTTLFYGIKQLGDELGDVRGGTSLDLQGELGNAVLFRTSLQALGYSMDETTARLENASSIIAIIGRRDFVQFTSEIQNITGAGSKFALTLAEMGEQLDADLSLRQQIGILDRIEGQKTVVRTAALYEQQLKATALLGKSISSISGASDDVLTSNAQAQLALLSMGPSADEFVNNFQSMAGMLQASGIGQGVNNAIQNALMENVAFSTDSDLFKALTAFDGEAGTDTRSAVVEANRLRRSGDTDGAAAILKTLAPMLVQGAKGLGEGELKNLQVLTQNAGPIFKELMLSVGQLSQVNYDNTTAQFNELAIAAKTLDNAFSKFRGSITSTMNNMLGAFGTPLAGIMDAFTTNTYAMDENNKKVLVTKGIFTTINEVADKVRKRFDGVYREGGKMTDKFKDLSEIIRKKINPIIEKMGEKLSEWLDGFIKDDGKKLGEYIDSMVLSVSVISGLLGAVAKVFGFLADIFINTDTVQDPNDPDKTIEKFNLTGTIVNGFLMALGYAAVKKAFAGAFSLGFSKIPGLGGFGKKAAGAGAGAGAGAIGMAAFGVAVAGVGVAILGISTAIEKLGNLKFGDMMQGMFGVAIIGGLLVAAVAFPAVGAAIGAFGIAALPAIPVILAVAAAIAAVGIAAAGIGAATAGISMLFDTPEEKAMNLANQTKNVEQLAAIDSEKLKSTAFGIESIAKSMVSFGDATNDGWFSGPDLDDQNEQLSIMQKFSDLDGTGLIQFTDGMEKLIETIQKLGSISTEDILSQTVALEKLNATTQRGFGTRVADNIDKIVDKFTRRPTPSVNPQDMATPPAPEGAGANPVASGTKSNNALLIQIAENTKKTGKGIAKLPAELT